MDLNARRIIVVDAVECRSKSKSDIQRIDILEYRVAFTFPAIANMRNARRVKRSHLTLTTHDLPL
jgi:hypothetical protein